MTELDKWLKEMLEREFILEEPIKEEFGNLVYKDKIFSLGENKNPYLLYKYSLWWKINGKMNSVPLPDNYDCAVLRKWIEEKLEIKPQYIFVETTVDQVVNWMEKAEEYEDKIEKEKKSEPLQNDPTDANLKFIEEQLSELSKAEEEKKKKEEYPRDLFDLL